MLEQRGGAVNAMDEEDLRQADLTHLRLQEMTPDQRAELKRRYDHFVRHFGRAAPASADATPKPLIRKWTPGAKS